ncbi:MAG: PilN domain-containing protein [Balneolales bacterium]|nr:PilN domain-containing protein [Balneolales bacterium]
MSKREITGISLDNDVLKLATLEISKDRVTVVRLQKARLLQPLKKQEEASDENIDVMSGSDDVEDAVFGIEDSDSLTTALNDDMPDDWDMASESAPFLEDDSNAGVMANLLREQLTKSITTAINIPFEQTYLQNVTDLDLEKNSKKKIQKELHQRLELLYGHPVTDDQISWIKSDDEKTLLVGSIDRDVQALKLLDESLPLFDGKVTVRNVLSEEIVLAGMVRTNYHILDHEYTCIVHVRESTTHVIFMKGSEFHSILPVIKEGVKNKRVARTIFSKVLFEVERGKIPTLDRILITGETLEGNLLEFLSEQFIDVEVGHFEYDGDKFDVDATLSDDYRDYLKAIGVAWASSEHEKADFINLTFLPKYVQTRQQVFKLEWHGFILLMMIALTPILFNYMYQQKQAELQDYIQTSQRVDQQIRETRVIAQMVDNLSAEYATYEQRVNLLDTLSYNAHKWSQTLRILNNSAQDVNSVWITNFQGDGANLILQGSAIHRDRIPRFSNQFHDAVIQQVTEREERGMILYDFVLQVREIADSPAVFRPEKVVAPDDILRMRETTDNVGTIEQ